MVETEYGNTIYHVDKADCAGYHRATVFYYMYAHFALSDPVHYNINTYYTATVTLSAAAFFRSLPDVESALRPPSLAFTTSP